MNTYNFLNTQCNNINELVNLYKANYKEAIIDIYSNTKKLIKFIKKYIKDKELINNIVDVLMYSKYKNNALTFIIFYLDKEKEVVINGQPYTFKEFKEALKVNKPDKENALYLFLEDYGLSKTYAKKSGLTSDDINLLKDSYIIEKNCYNEFTRLYLTTYEDYNSKETYVAKVKSIIINKEECFRRATKLFNNNDWFLYVAHKIDFNTAINIAVEKNPIFYSIPLFKEEIDSEELKLLISDAFFWNLLDNIEKYNYKKQVKPIVDAIIDLKKQYLKYKSQIEKKQIYSMSLDLYVNMARELYLNYLNFIYFYQLNLVTVKSKYDSSLYAFDKPYCKTFICQDYMNNRIIKLYNQEKTSDSIDDVSNDIPVGEEIFKDRDVLKKLNKQEKKIKSLNRFKNTSIFFLIISILVLIALIGINYIPNFEKNDVVKLINKYTIIILASSILLSIIFIIVLKSKIKKTTKIDKDYRFIIESKSMDLNNKQEAKLNRLLPQEVKLNKKAFKSHIISTTILSISLSLLFSLIALVLLFTFKPSLIESSKYDSYLNNQMPLLYFIAGPAIMMILSILFRKKGFFMVLFNFIISILAFVLCFILL